MDIFKVRFVHLSGKIITKFWGKKNSQFKSQVTSVPVCSVLSDWTGGKHSVFCHLCLEYKHERCSWGYSQTYNINVVWKFKVGDLSYTRDNDSSIKSTFYSRLRSQYFQNCGLMSTHNSAPTCWSVCQENNFSDAVVITICQNDSTSFYSHGFFIYFYV